MTEEIKNTIEVPSWSQVDDTVHRNDCGPASVKNILDAFGLAKQKTVGNLYDQAIPSGDTYTSYSQLRELLADYGINSTYRHNLNRGDLMMWIQEKRPMITLINYTPLQVLKPFSRFQDTATQKAGHFFTPVGMSVDHIIVNDPLWPGQNGRHWAIPYEIFDQAWGRAEPPFTALVMNQTLKEKVMDDVVNDGKTARWTITAYSIRVRQSPGTGGQLLWPREYVGPSIVTAYEEHDDIPGEKWIRISPDTSLVPRWIAVEYHGQIWGRKI